MSLQVGWAFAGEVLTCGRCGGRIAKGERVFVVPEEGQKSAICFCEDDACGGKESKKHESASYQQWESSQRRQHWAK